MAESVFALASAEVRGCALETTAASALSEESVAVTESETFGGPASNSVGRPNLSARSGGGPTMGGPNSKGGGRRGALSGCGRNKTHRVAHAEEVPLVHVAVTAVFEVITCHAGRLTTTVEAVPLTLVHGYDGDVATPPLVGLIPMT